MQERVQRGKVRKQTATRVVRVVFILLYPFLISSFMKYWDNIPIVPLLVPVVLNLSMLSIFGASLLHSNAPSMIEQFALKMKEHTGEERLPPERALYCKRVTILWCGLFLFNSAISLYLAWQRLTILWTWYNGFVAYILMGALLIIESIYRRYRFKISLP